MNDHSPEHTRDRPQFSLRSLLLIAVGAAVYVAIAMAVVRHRGRLLDIVADAAGIFALGCGLLAFAGFGMMVASLVRSRGEYLWPTVVLVAAIIYAPANLVLFIATLLVDRSAIFDDVYLISAVLVGPAIMLVVLVSFAGFFRRVGWLGLLGFTMWIESVAFAHLWVIAAAAASI